MIDRSYSGEEPPPPMTPGTPAAVEGGTAAENRGRPAPASDSGAVTGSGASAGGGGGEEDFDSDAAGGAERPA